MLWHTSVLEHVINDNVLHCKKLRNAHQASASYLSDAGALTAQGSAFTMSKKLEQLNCHVRSEFLVSISLAASPQAVAYHIMIACRTTYNCAMYYTVQ